MFALTELAEITELKYFISGKAGKKEHRLSLCTLCALREIESSVRAAGERT